MTRAREQRLREALNRTIADLSVGMDQLELIGDIAIVDQFAADLAAARIADARAAGAAWEDIARRLGVSRQAAHKRFAGPRARGRRRGNRIVELRIGVEKK
jgi:hypothetical protein